MHIVNIIIILKLSSLTRVSMKMHFKKMLPKSVRPRDASTMEDVMMLFFGNLSREEFLECYIAHFNAALA